MIYVYNLAQIFETNFLTNAQEIYILNMITLVVNTRKVILIRKDVSWLFSIAISVLEGRLLLVRQREVILK